MEKLKPFRRLIIKQIIEGYDASLPFSTYFKKLSIQNRNWGSKDRKIYKEFCFKYFRMGKGLSNLSLDEALDYLEDELEQPIPAAKMFLHQNLLSKSIHADDWIISHRYEKPVYLAVNPGREQDLMKFFELNNIEAESYFNGSLLKVPSGAKCDFLTENGIAWIMDYSSFSSVQKINFNEGDEIWDACSGAGGKSIAIGARGRNLKKHLCTDIRESVIMNLKQRFKTLNLKPPETQIMDLSNGNSLTHKFDKIMVDVPCSGSGTWGRNPENFHFFKPSLLDKYPTLQRSIVESVVPNLKIGAELYYLTCSVFASENETNVQYFTSHLGLELLEESYQFSSHRDSDTLYLAKMMKK